MSAKSIRSNLSEREKNYRLARRTMRCPKCNDKSRLLVELADGSLFCSKCNSFFHPHDETISLPLAKSSAGRDYWDGSVDNIEKIVEKDSW